MRVLGIDPGTRFTGFGVVEEQSGRLRHIAHGVVKAPPDAALEVRLHHIFACLTDQLERHRPDAVAVEGVFAHKNARSALILGHARGVALLVAAQRGLKVFEYSPARVKRSVGAGGADGKDAVARMVLTFLKLEEISRADASDALAVAICHLNQARFPLAASKLAASSPRRQSRKSALASLATRLSPAYVRAAAAR